MQCAPSGELTFAPGQTSKTVDVPVRGDELDEDDETFSLDLSSPTNAEVANAARTTLTIKAKDKFTFSSATYAASARRRRRS